MSRVVDWEGVTLTPSVVEVPTRLDVPKNFAIHRRWEIEERTDKLAAAFYRRLDSRRANGGRPWSH